MSHRVEQAPEIAQAGAGDAADSSVEELYTYNEKKAWREAMPLITATLLELTTVATQPERRVVVGNLKARPHPPLSRRHRMGDLHQTLEE